MDILNRLADNDAALQEHLYQMHHLMSNGWGLLASVHATAAASIVHELMDRADDLDELERESYDEMSPPEDYL
jgi:hypothetical protein